MQTYANKVAYNRKKERLKQELTIKVQELNTKLEQDIKIAKLTAKVANILLTRRLYIPF